ncbi:hypothetical protein UFOVP1146_353 [uncultured Caudovirales phage]|uniref:Uncharacterized protein n=1 Tax=uncultured Caudovirales phage TaxID=2100421 RepID=A0A6J5QWS7_9CAUD|nr:hypothetical protein UFOVP812_266 [uncultured Caudovirales phage]CAB4165763.1 hypothetical protein UFOVP818_299 [uncultured Caudovirales phage]CAB4187007.1 hypothetical protein UFOVP1146_353 [uncultured Caudovirales phage]CAB4221222.1 hypothetical protein UFOVP1638_212 [uncultured Caudovirales phage]
MQKTIIHTCSSILIRPNGIVRYINAVIDLQRSQGHRVLLITDAKPTQVIRADRILYQDASSAYVPNFKDGHVWLQIDSGISATIRAVYDANIDRADLVIAHDLHSYLALEHRIDNGIFIQHETDVLTPDSRWSFLDDDYLARQCHIANNSNWRIGNTVASTHITPPRSVYTPIPFVPVAASSEPRSRDLLYVGDATLRKGAREFMALARKLGRRPTVITHEAAAELFTGADVYTFGLDQREEMYALMAQHRVAYISSRNECPGLVVPECLQFMPVVVNADYAWTDFVKGMGAQPVAGDQIPGAIEDLLKNPPRFDRRLLESWAWNARQIWNNFVA